MELQVNALFYHLASQRNSTQIGLRLKQWLLQFVLHSTLFGKFVVGTVHTLSFDQTEAFSIGLFQSQKRANHSPNLLATIGAWIINNSKLVIIRVVTSYSGSSVRTREACRKMTLATTLVREREKKQPRYEKYSPSPRCLTRFFPGLTWSTAFHMKISFHSRAKKENLFYVATSL